MQGRNILLLILITAAVIVSGCTSPEADGDAQPLSPTPAPEVTEGEAVGGSLPAPTLPAPARQEAVPPYKVGFVDPATYHVPTPTPTIALRRPPDDVRVSERMVEYATATVDRPPRVLATEVYHIPFPYWDLTVEMTPTNEYPWFVMEVRDPEDPNRVIKTIRYSRHDILSAGEDSEKKKETFTIREGYGDYYFIIRSESLKSLTIIIEVPEKYLV
ncbi:hypothetical protein BN140_2590 [Methanoculleus bourgensis MS2]|jgi:hypothetical protein|uniref:Lipoprotein n=1 Tax=Methanoculleus bourgensis (strain ATCC 43281 / DSM 3045 / OCM 15 / MS2) TaxID=1201294 RepID=I7JB42_METBM|nr:hypothetical protein [Methanoculleus bourgensis]CCJ37513.1 hypothetical protein BN140_2590 [Methanoculleus bourgensis MS2]